MENKRMQYENDDFLNDEILTLAADILDEEIQEEIREHEERDIEIPVELDQRLLAMARSLDADRRAKKRKAKIRRMERLVACVLICVVSAGAITMGTSEGFRKKVFDLVSNDQSGGVTLLNDDEKQLIGSWENYWYPTYVPGGFSLIAADEMEHFLLFENREKNALIRISEAEPDVAVSIDSDKTHKDKIEVGRYDGYLFKNEYSEKYIAVWLTDNLMIRIEFDGIEKDEIMKVIENIKFVETNRR